MENSKEWSPLGTSRSSLIALGQTVPTRLMYTPNGGVRGAALLPRGLAVNALAPGAICPGGGVQIRVRDTELVLCQSQAGLVAPAISKAPKGKPSKRGQQQQQQQAQDASTSDAYGNESGAVTNCTPSGNLATSLGERSGNTMALLQTLVAQRQRVMPRRAPGGALVMPATTTTSATPATPTNSAPASSASGKPKCPAGSLAGCNCGV